MILVLCANQDVALFWRRQLFARGMCSVSLSYRYALGEDMTDATFDAVLIPDICDPQKPGRFCFSWKMRFPNIPIVILHKPEDVLPRDAKEADIVIKENHIPQKLIDTLFYQVSLFHGRDITDCMRGTARDHLLRREPTWCGIPLHLTPTERMIFRYLLHTSPRAITAKELHRNCMRPGTSPTLSNIFSHIYRINYKARMVLGHSIIEKTSPTAYRIRLDTENEVLIQA